MIEMKNEAESLVYNTEKQLKENDAKIPQDVKDKIRNDINAVNEAINSNNYDNTKQCLENLRNSAMEMGRAIYQNAGASGSTGSTEQNTTQDQQQGEGENKDNTQNKQ
jgi:molecular chaperone DnaK (HSP70)